MYRQILDPVAHSLAWSSLAAALPLATLFLMLGVLRLRAWIASVVSLAIAIAIAFAIYGMPIGQAALAGSEGAVFGFFPILWIVINAMWVYEMTVQTGHFDVLRRSFVTVSDDRRIQADTSANSLFGALQVTASTKAGLSPVLMAAGNSSGGVLGKMVSPQNLAIGAAAVGLQGKEGDVFRRVVLWSLLFLAMVCILSGLQASVLSWMVP